MSALSDTMPPPVQPTLASRFAWASWFVLFWEHHAALQTDAAERDRCEDEAWQAAREAGELARQARQAGVAL